MNEPRFVLDANLVVSAALIKNSVARAAFDKALLQGQILISDPIQEELLDVFFRPKLDRYVSLENRLRFLANFISQTTPIEITEQFSVCRDPKDNMIVDLAVSGRADCIISGDKDLLVLHPFRGIAVVTPRLFLDEWE